VIPWAAGFVGLAFQEYVVDVKLGPVVETSGPACVQLAVPIAGYVTE